jgi:hypothetical protein
MIGAFSLMQYAPWLIVVGTILFLLGFIGLAFRQSGSESELEASASGTEEGLSEPQVELALTQEETARESERPQRLEVAGAVSGEHPSRGRRLDAKRKINPKGSA